MGDKIERCRICFRKFKKEDTKYTVGLASFDHCDYNVRWRGDEKVIRLSKKASYRRIIANVCESCVTLASIEEVLGFGKKLRTKNYIPEFEGKGEMPVTWSLKKKIYDSDDLL